MSKELIAKTRELHRCGCNAHRDRTDLSCLKVRDRSGDPLDSAALLGMIRELADLAESEGKRADEAEQTVINLRRDNKALNDLVLAIERVLGISGYRAGESEEEICPRIARLKGQAESMRPVVESVRNLRDSTGHPRYQDALRELLFHIDLPPKEQP